MTFPALSEVDICNHALRELGQAPISSISSPSTDFETMVSLAYPECRQMVLRDNCWNFAKTEAQISLLSTTVAISTASPIAISGITQANPGVITTQYAHNLTTGQQVSISGIIGMTQLNGGTFTVTVITPTTLSLSLSGTAVNTSGYTAYSSGGLMQPLLGLPLAADLTADYPDNYALPSDFLRLLSLGGASESQLTNLYDIRSVGGQKVICMGNAEAPTINLRYIRDVTDLTQWDPLARKVLILNLALDLSYPITRDMKVYQMIDDKLKKVLPNAVSVDGQEVPPIKIQRSRLLDARRMGARQDSGYYTIFPYGS
jgi:hypothetical protein